ncbi:MAG TPA: carboxynorspermidine decarboxylase [Candidatus Avacidaminococcus intestinavium]|uniref:Carboxynorspermidine decarboxylase n=1 Tax=Candidatus Avacidaminococcus intestinavium TaxID=2840684 RepID=A0A9D1MQB7_9FIRM|nr:carboxynorspermidine decarboxylase [Candidatus Avacidaminococcus intestinavium]
MNLEFDLNKVATPYYIVDERLLKKNLEILARIEKEANCHILLAQKAFSMFALYPLIAKYLSGTAASGLYEARLGYEEMGKENHVFSPAYKEEEFAEILAVSDHLIFNSFEQWQKFKEPALRAGKSCGLRINPEHSTQEHAIYDPCALGSRLGVTKGNFRPELLSGLEGLHFHTLCEQNADALVETLAAVEEQFGEYFAQLKWINFGGGHHITRSDYDVELLIETIKAFKQKYNLKVYLEPGEAVALNAGYLVSSVVDIVNNDLDIAILDTSAACHMPDVIEMPYRPNVIGAGQLDEKAYNYRFGGPTCLAGDIIGEYSFDQPLQSGDKVVFCDMAIYSMVKNNTFNGMPLPTIAKVTLEGKVEVVRTFAYEDFKNRLS